MNSLSQYILEKFKISKDIKDSSIAEEIIRLCDIDKDNIKTKDFIYNWVLDNNITSIEKIVSNNLKNRINDIKYYTHKEEFEETDFTRVNSILTEYIINGKGEEFLTGKWTDPKLYYDKTILIYHNFIDGVGNIDKIFIKESK